MNITSLILAIIYIVWGFTMGMWVGFILSKKSKIDGKFRIDKNQTPHKLVLEINDINKIENAKHDSILKLKFDKDL